MCSGCPLLPMPVIRTGSAWCCKVRRLSAGTGTTSTKPAVATVHGHPFSIIAPSHSPQFYNDYARALSQYMSRNEGVGMDLTLVGAAAGGTGC